MSWDGIPTEYLTGLSGVYLLGGTVNKRQTKSITYGMYYRDSVYRFARPERMLRQIWRSAPKPSVAQQFTRFGATFTPSERGGVILQFDEESLRRFYLLTYCCRSVT